MLNTLLTFFAVGLIALLLVGVVLSVLGMAFSIAFGIAWFVLFKIAPIVLVGWIVLKLLDRRKPPESRIASDHFPRSGSDAIGPRP